LILHLNQLWQIIQFKIYLKGQYIYKEGIKCLKADKIIKTLKSGDDFGQTAILEEGIRSLDLRDKADWAIYSI